MAKTVTEATKTTESPLPGLLREIVVRIFVRELDVPSCASFSRTHTGAWLLWERLGSSDPDHRRNMTNYLTSRIERARSSTKVTNALQYFRWMLSESGSAAETRAHYAPEILGARQGDGMAKHLAALGSEGSASREAWWHLGTAIWCDLLSDEQKQCLRAQFQAWKLARDAMIRDCEMRRAVLRLAALREA